MEILAGGMNGVAGRPCIALQVFVEDGEARLEVRDDPDEPDPQGEDPQQEPPDEPAPQAEELPLPALHELPAPRDGGQPLHAGVVRQDEERHGVAQGGDDAGDDQEECPQDDEDGAQQVGDEGVGEPAEPVEELGQPHPARPDEGEVGHAVAQRQRSGEDQGADPPDERDTAQQEDDGQEHRRCQDRQFPRSLQHRAGPGGYLGIRQCHTYTSWGDFLRTVGVAPGIGRSCGLTARGHPHTGKGSCEGLRQAELPGATDCLSRFRISRGMPWGWLCPGRNL